MEFLDNSLLKRGQGRVLFAWLRKIVSTKRKVLENPFVYAQIKEWLITIAWQSVHQALFSQPGSA